MASLSANLVPDKPGGAQHANGQVAVAWAARADELAEWAWKYLVVRSDACGAYAPIERRGQEYTRKDGSKAKVPTNYTSKLPER